MNNEGRIRKESELNCLVLAILTTKKKGERVLLRFETISPQNRKVLRGLKLIVQKEGRKRKPRLFHLR